ncbi:MAG TPA: preprotein translocase subunit SecE [Casimicrobiaceae bacterium]|jgi:preprotein translocase subunit SecE|nr:preprotein translocase subunit SecE [Casimicrobiaceae bacterium]
MDKLKIVLAIACVIAGIWAYYYFPNAAPILRFLMVVGGLAVGLLVAWTSAIGREFFAFAQESRAEAGRVAWPTRKETVQTTAVVFAFVVVMALFLFAVDSSLAWLVNWLTGRPE